jgi:signal transduction histidine kinase
MRYLFFCIFIFASLPVFSIPEIVDISRQPYENIGKKVSYLEDISGRLGVHEAVAMDGLGKFHSSDKDILNLGNTKSAFWIKLRYIPEVNNRSYLIVDIPNIEQIDCFLLKENGQFLKMHAGSLSLPEKGIKVMTNYRFLLPDNSAEQVFTVYLRVRSNNIMLMPIKLTTSDKLAVGTSKLLLESIYIGVIFSLFFFNVFLFFSLGDKTYLYYSLYVFSLFFYVVLYLKGYSYLFGDQFRIALNTYPHIFHSFSAITAILFSRKFLNLKYTAPSWIRWYNIVFAFSVLEFLISILGFKSLGASYAQVLGVVNTILLMAAGIMLWFKGYKSAKYYVGAWALMSLTIMVFTFSLGGIFSTNDFTFNLLPIGSTVELLLLAFALGDRYRDLIRSERKTKDENLRIVRMHNEELERVVAERTVQLHQSIDKLEASNAVKNKLFSIVAHDLRSPFNSLVSIFTLNDMDMLSLDELKQLLNASRKNIDVIHHTLDNLLYWARNQMDASGSFFSVFDLNRAADTLLHVYQPLALNKSIVLKMEATEIPEVYADRNQVLLILRNLIDNAIKFTWPGGCIRIELKKQGNEVRISVSNPAVDPERLNLDTLRWPNIQASTPGTANERGVGLGLQLCHEFAKANGRKLDVQLIGEDIEFFFFLKIAD